MPPQIGNIISKAVYDNELRSNPLHPVTDQTTACYFIDVSGKEAPLSGGSFKVFFFHIVMLLFSIFSNIFNSE